MYKISLKGNFNLPIEKLSCELTPSRPNIIIADQLFEEHKMDIEKLSAFIKYELTDGVETSDTTTLTMPSNVQIVELKSSSKEELDAKAEASIINATGSSATNSETASKAKTIEEELNKPNDNIINATDASKKNYKDVKVDKSEIVEINDDIVAEVNNSNDVIETVDGASKTSGTTVKKTTATSKKKK